MPCEKSNNASLKFSRHSRTCLLKIQLQAKSPVSEHLPSRSGCAVVPQQGGGQFVGSHSGYPGLHYPEEEVVYIVKI